MISLGSVSGAARLVRVVLVAFCLQPALALAGGAPPEDGAFQRPGVPPSGPRGLPQGAVQPPAGQATQQRQQGSVFALPPPPEGGVKNAEQARLRLQDICMYRTAEAENPTADNGPRCACYGRTLAKSFNPDELAAFAAADEVPEGARDRADAVWLGCKGKRD
ncbi:hypothetical protein [Blastochloris viridis]|uniref:Secreted protein n=1 Tax=Blastochloris viridis TaxID=1079 RepID=A0A0H5B9W8_BLAVI|nr:hypothetical protein [Blastochloris viridis]ALK08861.1 hypothetical protein BVIR_1072 [Blastochloris viridis]BAR97839.1 hypothetical protein BV133_246 [Blastochloris viridis]CUU41522.1 hypothetical protein BVIRIDIS_05150 [Blastochloris viridis]